MRLPVVLDTNILFSATGWRGNPYPCLELARTGQIQAVTCAEIMRELAEKLSAKLNFSAEQIDETLADYLNFHTLVEIPGTLKAVPRDDDDNAVLECARIGVSGIIITGDDDLLSLRRFEEIEIMSAAEFLRRWDAGEFQRTID